MNPADFYDDILSSQIESGINDRIYRLYKKVIDIGIKKDDKLLEIGCGIGALTYLLAKHTKKGEIEAFDPSSKSIAFAKEKVRHPHVHFYTGEIASYSPKHADAFDTILLFDVLEHIPLEEHLAVFTKIESLLKIHGLLLINLPNPHYILFDKVHQPEVLQELDQPVFLQDLLPKLKLAKLDLFFFETHSVWVKDDYHFLIVRKQQEFREQLLSVERSFIQKLQVRFNRSIRKWKHRFP
jgi:trans-aconitate 2-methyltransferase